MIEAAPRLIDTLGSETRVHYDELCRLLNEAGINYKLNTHLVRGLDYYNRTVYEWVTTKLGSQGTIAAGGRYDALVERLGGDATPACGFGIGLERVFLLMQESGVETSDAPDVYLVNVGDKAEKIAFTTAEQLRNADINVVLHSGGGSLKSQMKKADKSGARYAVIIGEDEAQAGEVTLKPMREQGEQTKYSIISLINYFNNNK
ncbi:MAG TPA: His/Gly/Thr/Pro-type tRNA ligase C-terminal domain-containing protein, partial [Methylophilaceae bacterium]|nr:His/Gly/Thr/Pro-type tRNA ligase C-terminal domain-containing protein [Methylophilaceae bacterium]